MRRTAITLAILVLVIAPLLATPVAANGGHNSSNHTAESGAHSEEGGAGHGERDGVH